MQHDSYDLYYQPEHSKCYPCRYCHIGQVKNVGLKSGDVKI